MFKLKLVAGVILVFVVGVLVGSLGTRVYFRHRMEEIAVSGSRRLPRTAFLMKKLSEELDLTETQRAEVQEIVKGYRDKIVAIRNIYLPEIREITDQTFAVIREKLNSEQQQKLDKLQKKLERLRGRFEERGEKRF